MTAPARKPLTSVVPVSEGQSIPELCLGRAYPLPLVSVAMTEDNISLQQATQGHPALPKEWLYPLGQSLLPME